MANTITRKTILDGQFRAIVKVVIESDGVTGDETFSLFDSSNFRLDDSAHKNKITNIMFSSVGIVGGLIKWDATASVAAFSVSEHPMSMSFDGRCGFGGLPNEGGVGVTGDILFDSNGLDAANDSITFILEVTK